MTRPLLIAVLLLALTGGGAARAQNVTDSRAFANCRGGDGMWSEMRISNCNEIIDGGKASGADLAKVYYYRANARLAHSDYADAIEDYTRALEITPDDANALHERCFARAILGSDLDEALSDCNESLRVRPNDAESLGGRGFVHFRLGLFESAIADYDAAIALRPQEAVFFFIRGKAKLNTGDTEQGNADIASARALDPKVDAIFAGYEGAREGGVWSAMMGYLRSVLKWIY
jgi:tetratricopeptide (TPR) repeat protein